MANVFPCSRRGFVHGFNRVANALNHILHEDAGARPSNCIDDLSLVGFKAINQRGNGNAICHFHSWCCKGFRICTSFVQSKTTKFGNCRKHASTSNFDIVSQVDKKGAVETKARETTTTTSIFIQAIGTTTTSSIPTKPPGGQPA